MKTKLRIIVVIFMFDRLAAVQAAIKAKK